MELNHLRQFYEVARAGSFTAAARRLHVSQSALSKAVALLEDRQGVKLLQRSKKGISLTTVGNAVFSKCERIFQLTTEVDEACSGAKEVCAGPLRLGASDHVANYLLVDQVRELRREHPHVLPTVLTGTPHDIVGLLLNHEVEFGLFFTRLNVPGIRYETIATLGMAAVCAPQWAREFARLPTAARLRATLRKAGFIGSVHTQYRSNPSRDFLDQGPEPHIAFESNSQETQKRLCLQGGGVAYLGRFMVDEELKDGRLVELPLKRPIAHELLLAQRVGRELSLNSRTLLDRLRGRAKPTD